MNTLNQITSLTEDFLNDIDLSYKHYENDSISAITKTNFECKECCFKNIYMQESIFENSYFLNVIFQNCDFSNIQFLNTLFRNVQFINCKLVGSDFSDSMFDHVTIKESLCRFANFSYMNNKLTKFINCDLTNASITETKLNKTKFQECHLEQCEIFHSSLNNVDLSTSYINHIITSPEDIRGAIIDINQAEDLIHLLKVKLK